MQVISNASTLSLLNSIIFKKASMKSQKLFCIYSLLALLVVSLPAVGEDKQELPRNEKIRKILIGPVMGFGVAATTTYCASKMGWGSSPLTMLGCYVAYHALHRMIARKGEQYNKWQVVPALMCGYGCGYFISRLSSSSSAVYTIGQHLVVREGIADLSKDPNLHPVTLRTLAGKMYTVYVPDDATWVDVKQAFSDMYTCEYDDLPNDRIKTNRLSLIGDGQQLSDTSKVFSPEEGEFNYGQAAAVHLLFKIVPAGSD